MKTVEACSDIIQEICSTVRSTYASPLSWFEQSLEKTNLERVNVNKLVDHLYTVMEPVQKEVPIKIFVEDNFPKEINADRSKIFRGAINYLALACQRTRKGLISLRFFLRKDSSGGSKSLLLVTCEDTAPAVKTEMYKHLFKVTKEGVTLFEEEMEQNGTPAHDSVSPELCLFSVACEMNGIGGECGFRPRNDQDMGHEAYDKESGTTVGSLFWFCIPCTEVEELPEVHSIESDKIMTLPQQPTVTQNDASKFHQVIIGNTSVNRKKRALVIEDSTVVRKMLTKILDRLDFEV
jgi:hypothetical protein